MAEWLYLSFADADRPKGEQFLGGAYVAIPEGADSLTEATNSIVLRRGPDKPPPTTEDIRIVATIKRSHRLGINPGGEVMVVGPISGEHMDANVPAADRERLLTRAELEAQ